MNRLLCLALILFSFSLSADDAPADNLFKGFVYFQLFQEEGGITKFPAARAKFGTTTKNGVYFDINGRTEGNEVQQFWGYTKTSVGEFRLGRVFLAACYATPAPFLSRTARYPNAAFAIAAYGTGLQYSHSHGDWSLLVDVTGSSKSTYKSDGQFDRVESSARLYRKLGTAAHVATSYQVSEDFLRGGIDAGYKFDRVEFFAAVYITDEDVRRQTAGLVNVEWKMWVALRPHAQLDRRQNGDDVSTIGLGLGQIQGVYVAVDREFGDSDAWVARVQYRFDF